MAASRVKSFRRNGRIVKAHSRRRRFIRNTAIGVGTAGAIAGGGLLLKKKLKVGGVKAPLNGVKSRRRDFMDLMERSNPSQMKAIAKEEDLFFKRQAELFNNPNLSPDARDKQLLNEWMKVSPKARLSMLVGTEANTADAGRGLKQSLLNTYRKTNPTLSSRSEAFGTLKSYTKQYGKGGDVYGQQMNKKGFDRLREKARANGGKSAAGIRANIRRDLGFSGNPNLTTFTGRRWRKL